MADLSTTFKNIKDGVTDLTSLDVVTLTGQIKVQTDSTNKVDLGKIYEELSKQAAKTDSDIAVVAFTHVSLDRDAVQFVQSGLSEEEKALVGSHVQMVTAAQEARLAMIRTFKDLVGIAI